MAFSTPTGTYAPTRVPQGHQDASSYFQAVTYPLFEAIRAQVLQYLDDFLIHAKNEEQLLSIIEHFLAICSKYNLKIGAKKTNLFLKEARFCGRIISGDGIRFDPRNLETLQSMQQPSSADELSQFVHAVNWMRTSIPNFAEVVAPLRDVLRTSAQKAGKSTKKALAKVALEPLWTPSCTTAFKTIQESLLNVVTLAHFDASKATCLFTDASDEYWSVIITQTPQSHLDKPCAEQDHAPLAFLSGQFDSRQMAWSTVEKEAFPIVYAFDRFYYLLDGTHIHIFTDHKNLTYIYSPSQTMSKVKAAKLNRWATILSQKRYTIMHICLLYTSPSPRDKRQSRMPSSA